MKKFKFALQALLDHRVKLEESAQAHLAHELKQLKDLEEMRDYLLAEASQVKNYGEMTNVAALQSRVYANQYSASIMDEIVIKLDAIDKQKNNVQVARNLLLEATQNKKALEIHKENLFLEWKKQRKKFETSQLDDLASQSAFYKASHT